MLTSEQKKQFSEILDELGKTLDITREQHDAAVKSYNFVGEWLSAPQSSLSPYKPEILPQGSFVLGTMIKPIHDDDELDIDLVCRLEGKRADWTQAELKKVVGDRLADQGTLKRLLKIPDGRRCWTLQYADSAKFHLDILPSVVSEGYVTLMEREFSASAPNFESLAIHITDKKEWNYSSEVRQEGWPKSNPFGYWLWFEQRAKIAGTELRLMTEAVQPVPKYQSKKLPLQRVIQILKRHRDMMFNGDEDKPISIIITTLAAKAYNRETDILEALTNVIDRMPSYIEERYSEKHGKVIKWIANPVNESENFADKWPDTSKKQQNFYKWLNQVKTDLRDATGQTELTYIMESLKRPFGEKVVQKTLSNIGVRSRILTEQGKGRFDTKFGVITGGASTIKPHTFYGEQSQD